MTESMSLKATFLRTKSNQWRQHASAKQGVLCEWNIQFSWFLLKWLIWFFTLKKCIDTKSIMVQFAVTTIIRLYIAAYKVSFYHFVRLIIEDGLHWRAAYIFYLFILSKSTDDAHLFSGTLFQPTHFTHSILFSITCTSIAGGFVFNRRQFVVLCKHHYKGCQLNAKRARALTTE